MPAIWQEGRASGSTAQRLIWLPALVLVALGMHVVIIHKPPQPIFDEEHYVTDARSILAGEGGLRVEHPPLGRALIATGLVLCGDSPLGWRIFSVLFGTASIVLFYLLCQQLNISHTTRFLATFLLTFENLSFIQASVAMLDVFSVTFMLLSFALYLRGKYLLSAVSVGLSTLSKLSGALAIAVIFLHWLLSGRGHPRHFLPWLLLAPASFLLLMIPLDFLISGQVVNPISNVKTMLSLSSSLTFANTQHPGLSRPWDWVLRPLILPYWYEPHYLGAISFTLWALIVPCVIYMIFKARQGDNAALFGLCWFAGTYLFWIPISIVTDRISFVYYFYPTVGAICIGVALGLSQLLAMSKAKSPSKFKRLTVPAVVAYLVLHFAVFLVLSPLSTWWSVSFFV